MGTFHSNSYFRCFYYSYDIYGNLAVGFPSEAVLLDNDDGYDDDDCDVHTVIAVSKLLAF